MGILKQTWDSVKEFILKGFKKNYVKAIVICIGIVICFSSGLFTGCENYREIKTELHTALIFNRNARQTISSLEADNRGLEQGIERLRNNERNFEDRYTELSNVYKGIRSAYLKLQEGLVQSELYNSEAKKLIRESLKLIEEAGD